MRVSIYRRALLVLAGGTMYPVRRSSLWVMDNGRATMGQDSGFRIDGGKVINDLVRMTREWIHYGADK
jgi:hypothetical protein